MNDIKEVIVVSGKGGTGKTSVVGSLVSLMTNRVAADCDVDAANLHMILNPMVIEEKEFIGGKKATIDPSQYWGAARAGMSADFRQFLPGAIS